MGEERTGCWVNNLPCMWLTRGCKADPLDRDNCTYLRERHQNLAKLGNPLNNPPGVDDKRDVQEFEFRSTR